MVTPPPPAPLRNTLEFLQAIDPLFTLPPRWPRPASIDNICFSHPLDRERELLSNMRRKAHEACNYIYFPGTHPSPGAVVHFRFIYPLKHSTTLSVRATGSTKFHLNGKIFARIESSHSDRHLTLSDTDTQPHNTLNAIVTPLLGAAMLCLSPQWVTSQVKAECSHDGRIWVPAVATPIFKAPEFQEHAVYPIAYDNHTADFGSNILGIPEFTVSGKGTIQLFPGESLLEAQNANPHHCEQATPVFNVSGTRTIEGPELALQIGRAHV